MKYLKIQNNGLLDIRLVALMGGTTKSNDQYKIGQWGSGLKYTLAWLIKNNIDFHIFIGTERVEISTETETIRGEDFEIICINGKRTSVTTMMGGKAWDPWMIVRELWCNALDEGGEKREITETTFGEADKTTFYIQASNELMQVWNNWGDYFVHDVEPLYESDDYRVYPGSTSLKLYKQGVLIYEDKNQKSLFRYDSRGAEINELREFKGAISREVVHALADANEKVVSYYYENINGNFFEASMDYDWWKDFGPQWKSTLGNAKIIHKKAMENMRGRGINVDESEYIVVPEKVYKFLTKKFDGIGALRTANKIHEFFEVFDANLDMKIKSALSTLEACGYFIHPELRFIYGVFGDKTVMAQINIDEKLIMVSERMVDRPMFDVIAMIIEENEHFNTGLSDETRGFQQHFIDLYTKTLLELNNIPV